MYSAATMASQRVSFMAILVSLKRVGHQPSCALISALVSSSNPYGYLSWLTERKSGRQYHVLVKETMDSQNRYAMAFDDKMDKPTEYVGVPVLATELVAGRRGD